jgi:hypothetical protein
MVVGIFRRRQTSAMTSVSVLTWIKALPQVMTARELRASIL